MDAELQNKLFEKYPKQFREVKYIGCDNGWYSIIDKLCNTIENRIDYLSREGIESSFFWSQIKSKFAGLRCYSYGADEYMRGAISMAETISYSVCEVSGEKGFLCKKNGWIYTVSESVRLENDYEIFKETA
jgi:hypothetical protein